MSKENKSSPVAKESSKSLLKSGIIVSAMTLLSRVFGLLRDVAIAYSFGASSGSDAFFVAFKIPNFLRRLFAEGAFAQAFVPVLSEYRVDKGHAEVKSLINSVAGSLGFILLVLTILACAASDWLALIFAPGFSADPAKLALAGDILRLTFPYLLLISLTAFAGSILNSYGQFAAPAFTPVLLNLSLISCALFLAPAMKTPVMALAWGVLLAGMLQLFFQLPFLVRLQLLPIPQLNFRHSGVRKIIRLMLPAIFGVSVSQINLLLDTVLASFLETGSVSWLYYSDRLSELPLGLIGIAISTVILPSLSRSHTKEDDSEFSATMEWAMRSVLLIGLPAFMALFLLAEPLVVTLYHYGEITDRDALMAAKALMAYAFGLPAFMLIKILAPGFFAKQDTRTPVKVGIIAMVANMVFNLLLIWHFAHVGLAMATSLSAWLNAGLLFFLLRQRGVFIARAAWPKFALQASVALAALVIFLWFSSPTNAFWYQGDFSARAFTMLLIVTGGVVVYFAVLLLCGFRIKQFLAAPRS